MGAFQQLSALIGDLTPIAKKLNYPDSSVCILGGNIEELKKNYPDTYDHLFTCGYNRDNRPYILYGQDLVASWLFEDYLMKELAIAGLDIKGAGADKNREILPNAKVSSSSDCLIHYDDKQRLLELMSDYTGYWAKYKRMELRDAKFTKMRESQSLFLGVSTVDHKYILLDMAGDFNFTFIPSYFLYGGKPAYSIKLTPSLLKGFDFTQIALDIKSMI